MPQEKVIRKSTLENFSEEELLRMVKKNLDELGIEYEEKPGGFGDGFLLDPSIFAELAEEDSISDTLEEFAEDIASILCQDYGLTKEQAVEAVHISLLEDAFNVEPDLAMHRSYDVWAKEVFCCWENARNKSL